MPQIIVSDTNIWIACHRVGLLEKIFQLPHEFVTTDFAFDELITPQGLDLLALGLRVVALPSEDVAKLYALNEQWRKPSLPDISCFLYASQQQAYILLTGDGAIRQRAEQQGVRVHGVLWLLDEMVLHAVLLPVEAAQSLQMMCKAGTFLPGEECEKRLKLWKQVDV